MSSEPAGELSVQVVVNGCASGCTSIIESTCEIEVGDGELLVHSSIQVQERRGPEIICPAACVPVGANCTPRSVPPGEYALRHGDESTIVRLPLERQLLLAAGSTLAEESCR